MGTTKEERSPEHFVIQEWKKYSQAGQDGVVASIFNAIGTTNKYFVEFGAGDGLHLSNTANLRLHEGWKGLLMDMEPKADIVMWETITAENIQGILLKHKVPKVFDYLSIDMDGMDWWVWRAIIMFWPRVVSIEFNSKWKWDESFTVRYDPGHLWDGTDYYGASLAALHKLGGRKGYQLVHIVENLDAFFIRTDCLGPFASEAPQDLLPNPISCFPPSEKSWKRVT